MDQADLSRTPREADATSRPGSATRSLPKGQQTRAEIVDAALQIAAQVGLEGLSIGNLAEAVGKSKSGVFAHFGSRDELQIAVIREYYVRFETEVFRPAIRKPRGLPRVRALFENWLAHTTTALDSGNIFISGAVEFDDRPGPVRDALAETITTWIDAIARAVAQAIEEGHLRADADPRQVTFEIHGLILALHFEARFMRRAGAPARARQGFANVLARYGA